MTRGGFLGKLFRQEKHKKEREASNDNEKENNGNNHSIKAKSSYKTTLATPNLTPNASKMSKAESVDSIHFHKLKLSRFLEKRWASQEQKLEGVHNNVKSKIDNFRQTSATPDTIGSTPTTSSETPIKAIKFNDFDALLNLTHKYGKIPSSSENLFDLYSNNVDHAISEATSADTALIIGKGAGGSVFPIYNKEIGKVYAIKKIRKVQSKEKWGSYIRKLKDEFKLAHSLDHQNVVKTYDLLKDEDLFIIVMDYIPYDFFTLIMANNYDTLEAYCYFKQMVNGVAYLHGRGVAHRDLKLDNCVVDKEGVLKLVDFGSAVIWDSQMYQSNEVSTYEVEIKPKSAAKVTGILGSDPYLSPELFYQTYYDPTKADVWSLAIVFCCMIIHQFPWRLPKPREDKSYNMFTMHNKEIVDEKGRKKIVGPQRVLNKLPEESRELISGMLELVPEERLSIFDIQRDPFLKSIVHCHYNETGAFIAAPNHTHHFITRQDFALTESKPVTPKETVADVKADNSMQIPTIILNQEKSPDSSN